MADLSKLLGNVKTDAPKRPTSDFKGATHTNYQAEHKNAVAGQTDPLKAETAKTAGDTPGNMPELSPLQAGKLLQEKIMKGECSIWAINHALKRNAPPEEIALIAVKGLSLVTSDPMIFKTVSDIWRDKYGMVIEEKPPYKITYLQKQE